MFDGEQESSWLKVFPHRVLICKGTISDCRLEKLDITLTGWPRPPVWADGCGPSENVGHRLGSIPAMVQNWIWWWHKPGSPSGGDLWNNWPIEKDRHSRGTVHGTWLPHAECGSSWARARARARRWIRSEPRMQLPRGHTFWASVVQVSSPDSVNYWSSGREGPCL